jgi:hypothetical protein
LIPGYMSNSPSPHKAWLTGHRSETALQVPGPTHSGTAMPQVRQGEQQSQACADVSHVDGRQLHKLREKYEALKMKYIKQTLKYNELQQVVLGAAHAAAMPGSYQLPARPAPSSTQPSLLPYPAPGHSGKVTSEQKPAVTHIIAQPQAVITQQPVEATAGAPFLHPPADVPPRAESPRHLGRGSLLDEPSFGLLVPGSPTATGQATVGAIRGQTEQPPAMHTWSNTSAARSASIAAAAAAVAARAAATAAAGAHITIGSTATGGHHNPDFGGPVGQKGGHAVDSGTQTSQSGAAAGAAGAYAPQGAVHTSTAPAAAASTLTFHARTTSIANSNYSVTSSTQVADDEGSGDDRGASWQQTDLGQGQGMHMARHSHSHPAPTHGTASRQDPVGVGPQGVRRPPTHSHEGPQVPREVLELAAAYAGMPPSRTPHPHYSILPCCSSRTFIKPRKQNDLNCFTC